MNKQRFSTSYLLQLGRARLQTDSMSIRQWEELYPGSPKTATIRRRFGGWNKFLLAAGSSTRTGGLRWTRNQLLQHLRDALAQYGYVLSQDEWDRLFPQAGTPTAGTIARRFDGWKNAWASAGAEPVHARHFFSDEDILGILRHSFAVHGRTLTIREWEAQHCHPDFTTIHKRFGSWNKAWKKALIKR